MAKKKHSKKPRERGGGNEARADPGAYGGAEALAEVPREKGLYISYTREQTGSVFTSVNTFVWRFRFERAYVP